MAYKATLPMASAEIAGGQVASPPYYAFFRSLATNLSVLQDSIDQTNSSIDQAGSSISRDASVKGVFSVLTTGSLNTGTVKVSLDNDVQQAKAFSFYGAIDAGLKGWWEFSDNFQKNTLADVDDIEGWSLDLTDLPDSGTGTLQKTEFDAKGRKTGTATATTTDLTEGDNLYFTDARAAAAAPIQSIVQGSGVLIDKTDPRNPIISATGTGGSAGVPYIVFDGDTYSVPRGIQALFTLPIELEGAADLDVSGHLVEVM